MTRAASRGAGLWLAISVACAPEPPANAPSGPVGWSLSAAVDKTEVQVGEALELELTLTHPVDGDFVPPSAADFAPFTAIENEQIDESPTETRLRYRLAAYVLPQELEIPAVSVRYRDDRGELAALDTAAIDVSLVTSLTPDVTEIHDIKDPVGFRIPRDWSLLWWLLAALAAALLAYWLYRKFRKEPDGEPAPAFVAPLPPPDVEAERALARLADKQLIERGQSALFYTELTEIMRRYAGRRFEVPYLERTTSEILRDLRGKKAPSGSLRAILETADLVKFAKGQPAEEDAQSALGRAHSLVEETRPKPSAEVASP